MMFRPGDRCWIMDYNEAWSVKRWLQRSISSNDIWSQFHGNPPWLTMIKVTDKGDATHEIFHQTLRSYNPIKQKDEIIMDMFDISLSHRIIGTKYPWEIYIMECDAKHPDTNIDIDMIEAIVGKIDG